MRTLGLIGGMSWESTIPYYRLINERVRERAGGLRSARLVLVSVDFAEIERMQHADDWAAAGRALGDAAVSLERAGAGSIVICTNTMHRVADAVAARTDLPILHIADATAEAIRRDARIRRVGLLGTRFTMEQDFYRARLARHGLETVVPDAPAREVVHCAIYDELCRGIVSDASRAAFRTIFADLVADGAQAVILGCTEIGLLVGAGDATVPLFDTTAIHARAAADWALADEVEAERAERAPA